MTQVQYLLRYIPDGDVPFLQSVFERLVLEGGPQCYTLATAHLARDSRIHVNVVGCCCHDPPPSLFECAFVENKVDMLLMLMDTGRLEPNFQNMRCQIQRDKENYEEAQQLCDDDELVGKFACAPFDLNGRPFDLNDRESLCSHLVDHLETHKWDFGWIGGEGAREMVCKRHLSVYHTAQAPTPSVLQKLNCDLSGGN